ncbi:SDR family oxidoreductase [Mesorhizobium sp. B3-2-1]|uniref:SDR family NAD(P)-dependent oxidoreductase n=1 Tax=unclassified Mesorhizobium TaxID=325217 RepID=UPI00112A55E5|nr:MULTISPECIES: SDR family oxidoreductase [unclassified Mesorhizobium]MBZ9672669.1 SDR family oxidoreductase [Mesorhizobium sp. ES1-3]MBZ9705608.1 SDR family oxidoreductase [Mesorhizobium sp. ESP7-2]TPI26702.1 SDR family oxidoreductase [Mesorhizobium sp. B3-2-1]
MSSHSKPLSGQTVLVTGASGAIGSAIVQELVQEGARPIIHYGRDQHGADILLNQIGGAGWTVQADLASAEGPIGLWNQAVGLAGRVDAIVNNAGVRTEISVEADLDDWQAAWRREFQLDFFAVTDLCKAAILHFRAHGGGRIINMASRAGQRGYSAEAMPYGAAKAALINLTRSIARSFGADGIVAIAIAPGWVRTQMAREFVSRFGEAAAVADIPIGRMAEPSEIAELVSFALRPSQRSLSGATLDVNGASYIR